MIFKLPFLPFDLSVYRVHSKQYESKPKREYARIRTKNYNKIFCIGSGKTGTTSLEKLLKQFGFKMGNQPTAEVLSRDWLKYRDAERIIKYCYTADAFQDAPFGYPDLYKELDKAFPDSRFILTVRDSPEDWYQSLLRFHTKLFSSDPSRPPTESDLANSLYRYKGYLLEGHILLHGYPKVPLYDEDVYKRYYIQQNNEKRNYFANRREQFIEIKIGKQEDFQNLCNFLNVETNIEGFPWENRSQQDNSKDT
jgi:hypothetical protein